MDPSLNKLFKWSVENTASNRSTTTNGTNGTTNDLPPSTTTTTTTTIPSGTTLDPEVLSSLFGGPSDADLMLSSMSAINSTDPEVTLDDKLIAFDNFEQLIENLDNANNLEPLSLWPPLLDCLKHEEAEIRRMAAWCIGTAVQNNIKSQEKLAELGGVELLVGLVTRESEGEGVRRKAVYALSSACRNFQSAMDRLTDELGRLGRGKGEKVDASDMDACDEVIGELREVAAKDGQKAT